MNDKSDFQSKFSLSLKDLRELHFLLGIEVLRNATGLYLTQQKYVKDLLFKTKMDGARGVTSPMSSGKQMSMHDGDVLDNPELYRSTVGALQYLTLTRPEIAFAVNKLSQFVHTPFSNHWEACKKMLRYLKDTIQLGLHLKASNKLVLHGFADSDWASNPDNRRSTSGYCVFLGPNLIAWSSKKQQVVARSSTEVEYRALAHISAEFCWLQSLATELKLKLETPVVWSDNMGAAALASNPVMHARTKHIEIDIHFVRDKVLKKELEVRYIPTQEQVADIFTKALGSARFLELRSKLSVAKAP